MSVHAETVIYARPKGHALKMTLFREPLTTAHRRPCVLLIHGGAWTVGSRILPRWYAMAFAKSGFVAASIDYRKMPRYSFPACLCDVQSAVRWLRSNADLYSIDADSIAAMGESAGGHLALMLASRLPYPCNDGTPSSTVSTDVQAAVCLYAPTDLTFYLNRRGQGLRGLLSSAFMQKFLQGSGTLSEKVKWASPIFHVANRPCPVLMMHGDRDRVVPFEQSVKYQQESREVGNWVELITFEGKGHAFDYLNPGLRPVVFSRTLDFLQKKVGILPLSDAAS